MPKSQRPPSAGESDPAAVDPAAVDPAADSSPADAPRVGSARSPEELTSLDGEEFLAVNRSTRDRLRAEADGKKRRRRGRRRGEGDATDRVPGRVAATGSRRGVRAAAIVLAALSVILAATTVSFAFAWMQAEDRAEAAGPSEATRSEIMRVARDYAATVATYDPARYDDLDRRIQEISTPEFAKTYITSSRDARRGNAAVEGTSQAVSNDAGVVSLSDGKAVVLVTLDQTVTSPQVNSQVPEGIQYQSRVKVTLEQRDGRWLLAEIDTV
ncbi:hypothetical protein GIY30_06555 [Gordonia sp. HNM0687]|uniref:Mce-associated membrane protein n=1 Tax=Gordonia mangrovi TaxID=2665643 RepID=A0A6L7GQR9_9ACTN|nr:hypothetical protein [Gordonia mangrovi]MXP21015.1 hypothetical protein [Gordonia mangrovi]UVF78440.1 hypothetical protein NWF22_00675 [Gordonia mangrovi]